MKLFVDLDGVLVDFERGVWRAGHPGELREPSREEIAGYARSLDISTLWRTVDSAGDGFWTRLGWMPGGRELWAALAPLAPTVLTGVSRDPRCGPEKRLWCARELGPEVPVVTCFAYQKRDHAERGAVLIDDKPEAGPGWIERGGRFVLHKDAAATLAELRGLGVVT